MFLSSSKSTQRDRCQCPTFFKGDFCYLYTSACVPIIKAMLAKLLSDVSLTENTLDVLNSKIKFNHQMH